MSPIKPTTLNGMTQRQIDFFAEWDPAYLQSLKAETAIQDKESLSNPVLQKHEENIQPTPSPQPPSTTFEEWKAKAVVDGKKENAGPLSPVKNKGPHSSSTAAESRGSHGRKSEQNQHSGHRKRGSVGASSGVSTTREFSLL